MSEKPKRRWLVWLKRLLLAGVVLGVLGAIWAARTPARLERARAEVIEDAHALLHTMADAAQAHFEEHCAMPAALPRPTAEPLCTGRKPCALRPSVARAWEETLGVKIPTEPYASFEATLEQDAGTQIYTLYAYTDLVTGPPAHTSYIRLEGATKPECALERMELTTHYPMQ
ncbi:MAG: hypothetical protein AAGI01_02615 [Myxococcota bacterium]